MAPEWIRQAPLADIIVHACNLQRGDYGFVDEVMGYYRIHDGGLFGGTSRLKNVKETLAVYHLIGQKLGLVERPAYQRGIRALKVSYLAEYMMEVLLPMKLNNRFDTIFGKKVRYFVRRVLSGGWL